ncbi:MAG: single-stranded-DNA-specific exonuclease RecJ [Chloroflexi bacterium]|nr:MAG: single-stranded-DNA-specific exonuclease RecJ [Chloroflexota bacterium]
MLCHLLYCRGYQTEEDIYSFFTEGPPSHDPLKLPDIDAATGRIRSAIERHECVAIYGDFDCDGLTSSAALEETLRGYGLDPLVHIPSREEGHGLHPEALVKLASTGATLLISVDCGVTAIDEVQVARKLGMDVIVTDHHEPRADGSLPDCPVVDPVRHDSHYPFRGLCGVGVVYKLAQALALRIPANLDPDDLLDLVALGTVADVVPLRDENRFLVMQGLRRLQKTSRAGLRALFEVAGVDPARLDPTSIGFYLAPRVNAANRLADPNIAYALLTARDPDVAKQLARTLSAFNEQRQSLVNQRADQLYEAVGDPEVLLAETRLGVRPPVLIEVGEWTAGISGLLASKLSDRYGLPAFVGSESRDTVSVSARGVGGVYIDEILEACELAVPGGLFHGYGGHARAGGFRVSKDRWELARITLEEQARLHVPLDVVGTVLTADADVPLRKLTAYAASQVLTLAPFGNEFGEPLFLVRDVSLMHCRVVSDGSKHVKLKLQQGDMRMSAVHFNSGDEIIGLSAGTRLDILCHVQLNHWRDMVKAELCVRDWRLAE